MIEKRAVSSSTLFLQAEDGIRDYKVTGVQTCALPILPDRDYFSCAQDEIADTVSELTIVGGKVVYAGGSFTKFEEVSLPPAMPDWSPVRRYGGYAAWGDPNGARKAVSHEAARSCGCANHCSIHGHDHARAWSGRLPVSDLKSFWGALGCACWAV